jgi:5-methylcytosine-specific restriction protein A
MDKMVLFNVAWMKRYQGLAGDAAVYGGSYVDENEFGAEIFNFQHFRDRVYGFVEPGWEPLKCINITRLGAQRADQSVSGVLAIWVARQSCGGKTVVVGWYENAKVYRKRQRPPANSHRKQPDGQDAPYFVEADKNNCLLIPQDKRDFQILRATELRAVNYKAGGIGQSNIWYAQDPYGTQIKPQILQYIAKWKAQKHLSVPI